MVGNFLRKLDISILFVVSIFCILSIVFIHSSQQTGQYATENFAMKQGINYVIGFILLFAVAYFDSDQIEKWAWPLYITGFFLLIVMKGLPESIVPNILGAKRWINSPIGSIQVSELFKFALLLLVSHLALKHNQKYMERTVKTDFLLAGKLLLVTLPPTFFVYQQPDTGMAVLYLVGVAMILFLSGVQKKVLLSLASIPIIIFGMLTYIYIQHPDVLFHKIIPLLKDHQQQRIISWLSEEKNSDGKYQTDQAIMAVGSGELHGKGLGHGTVYVPEKHTDFIFSTVAEEGGFIVASIVICLFFLLVYRIIVVADTAVTPFGTFFCAGTAIILAAQIFQNIGMMVGIMPVKGIALPFLTYGGSSLFSNMILLGTILSVRKPYRKYMFDAKA